MKKQLMFGSLIALTGIAGAQTTNTFPANGSVGIGTLFPSHALEVITNNANAGIMLNQTSAGSSALYLKNTSSGGRNWAMLSLGYLDTPSPGDFGIWDMSTPVNRFYIEAATGNVGIGLNTGILGRLHVAGGALGVRGDGTSASSSTGFYGTALGTNNSTGSATGVYGAGTGSHRNNGGFFESSGDNTIGGVVSYGVYAKINNPGANDYAGYFDGNVNIIGAAYCTSGTWTGSDRKLKKDILPLVNGLNKIMLLKPSTYNFRTDEFKAMNLPKEKQLGVIAQELEEVFPELVTEVGESEQLDKDGKVTGTVPAHKAVNYTGLIPVLIAGVQEQETTIEAQQKTIESLQKTNDLYAQAINDLQKQMDEQKQLINSLSQKVAGTTGINSPGNIEGFQMSQNEPNPFTHETVVKYTLPQTVNSASMIVYDLTGKQINTFQIREKGSSSMTITSEKLSAGIYIYSIIADGKVVDSKRMIVAEK